ncbi:MAG: type II toxin-antitoxin system VapC family toxin [Deltaproteobacteria bacterium]|nr:type II toxin-antitoxin system VapC family toxin [Deltaproteobacteria bacterium]
MKLLLDTHVLLWWDQDELPARVVRRIQGAEQVYVSAATAWEIGIKRTLGKLKGKGRVADVLADYGFLELPITIAHAERVESLPQIHRDPFDRILVAQALEESLVLVSDDERIREYGAPVIWG